MRKLRLHTLALFIVLLSASSFAQAPRKLAFRAVHYDVTATLVPAEQKLVARATVEFQVLDSSRIVEVELHPNLRVNSVVGAGGKSLSFDRDDAAPLALRVTLPEPATLGQKVTLTVDYSGPLANEENSPSKGVRLASINEDGAYLLLPARWFPLTNYPANRYTAVFNIEVPQNFAVVGTGKSGSASTVPPHAAPAPVPAGKRPATPASAPAAAPSTGPMILYAFQCERPEPWGTFVAGNLRLSPQSVEGLNIAVYTRPEAANTAAAYAQAVAQAVNFFSSEVGPLPEPNLTVAQLPEGTV